MVKKRSEADDFADSILDMFRAQFGDAMKGYWFYGDPLCPCCGTTPIDVIHYKGEEALSVNGFMYREKGILIAYALCGTCAGQVLKMKREDPKSPQHQAIEQTLKAAYNLYLRSLEA